MGLRGDCHGKQDDVFFVPLKSVHSPAGHGGKAVFPKQLIDQVFLVDEGCDYADFLVLVFIGIIKDMECFRGSCVFLCAAVIRDVYIEQPTGTLHRAFDMQLFVVILLVVEGGRFIRRCP